MKNVIWTRKFRVAINGKPDWNKGINEVLVSQMSNGLFCAGVLYINEYDRKEMEALFRLEQFVGVTADEVWEKMDAWVNEFTKGMGGFEYIEK